MIKEWDSIPNEARPKIRYWLPAAAMDEDDLRRELGLLKERGFGGVEIVDLLRGAAYGEYGYIGKEDGWGTDRWESMIKVIADTTEGLGMTMDITNGPMWPISMPTVKNADDPAAVCELTCGAIECPEDGHYKGKVPARKIIHDEGKTKLIHLMAYLEKGNKILIQDSYRNLTGMVTGDDDRAVLDCIMPPAKEGTKWLIFAFYRQPSAEKTSSGAGQFYVIDHLSRAGAKACEDYWEPILQKYNYPSMESIFCDSLEYNTCLDWTPAFPDEFERRRGYSVLPYLPFIGVKSTWPEGDIPGFRLEQAEISDMINHDYIKTLTECYCEYHLTPLRIMAEKHGKTLRCQVAYGKPLEIQKSTLYVEIPENEALGNPAMDAQKTMAAAVHLGRKKRYSFECAAEYANAYGQNYEDLFWWVKRGLMSGMNAQVLHGASYSGSYYGKYSENGNIPGLRWPGFEAFRRAISNYWNRTLSVEDSRGCMDTIARMNALFLKKAKVDCAVYTKDYLTRGRGGEFCVYRDEGRLTNSGYSYEPVSPVLLELPICKVKDGILDKDGVGYKCLIVPEQERVSCSFLLKVQELLDSNFPVIWIGKEPCFGLYYAEWKNTEDQRKWKSLADKVWESGRLIRIDSIADVPETLKKHHIPPSVQLDGTMDITTALRTDEEKKVKYYALYAYNRVKYTPDDPNPETFTDNAAYRKGTVKGWYQRPGIKSKRIISVKLTGEGQVYQCNPWSGELVPLDFVSEGGYCAGKIAIEEDEMVILAVFERPVEGSLLHKGEKKVFGEIPVCIKTLELERFHPDKENERSFLRSGFSKDKLFIHLKGLLPWYELDSSLEEFAGRGTYLGSIVIDKIYTGKRYVLRLGDVSDTFHVYINGVKAPFPDQVLKEVDITNIIAEGENRLKIVVVSNLYNNLVGAVKDKKDIIHKIPIPYSAKKYGIWEEEDKKCSLLVIE